MPIAHDPTIARTIYQVGQEMGATRDHILAAFAAGLVESNMENLRYGDRDSQGVFQQRPSQGWGTVDQVTDPEYAARKFFEAAAKVGDYSNIGDLAQQVQRSAYPERYQQRLDDARTLLGQYGGGGGWEGTSTPTTGYTAAQPEQQQQAIAEQAQEDSGELLRSILRTVVDRRRGDSVDDDSPRPDERRNGELVSRLVTMWGPDEAEAKILEPGDLGIPADKKPQTGKLGDESQANEFIEMAKQFIGTPYVWGGESPSGFDCSGLIQYVADQMGIELPRVSRDQARAGRKVSSIEKARPGDLVAFNSPVSHIGIYLGDGMMLEAPRTGLNVRISSIAGRDLTAIRRIF